MNQRTTIQHDFSMVLQYKGSREQQLMFYNNYLYLYLSHVTTQQPCSLSRNLHYLVDAKSSLPYSTARHWSLSRTRFNQFRSSDPITLRSNLISFSHLHPCLSTVYSHHVFLPKSCINLSFLPCMPHSPPISSSSVGSRNDTRCTPQNMNFLLLQSCAA